MQNQFWLIYFVFSDRQLHTLGRFSKSTNRLQSPSNVDYDYRSAQTLPRKLEHKPMHSSAINIAIVNNVRSPPPPSQGPAKPARTYKALNRSKSFNVHGLNGTNDPSPIYMSKLNRNVSHHPLYRSNPHLNEEKPQLRSPSIVNLISRSQRDLSKIDENSSRFGADNQISASSHDIRANGYHPRSYTKNVPIDRRAHSLLRITSDNYRTPIETPYYNNELNNHKYGLERDLQRERESSLGSRSPITINKDTAAIIRRNSSSTEDYSDAYKTARIADQYHAPVKTSGYNYTKKSYPIKSARDLKTNGNRHTNGDSYATNLRYITERGMRKNSASPVVIEVRGRK